MAKFFKSLVPKPAAPKPDAAAKPKAPNLETQDPKSEPAKAEKPSDSETRPKEIGGPEGPEPTRYGDWERGGRCFDF